jgi:hypothetical protein
MELGEAPASFEFSLVPEESIEEVAELLEEHRPNTEDLFGIIDADSRLVYLCPACGRLHVQSSKDSVEFEVYTREVEEATPSGARVGKKVK